MTNSENCATFFRRTRKDGARGSSLHPQKLSGCRRWRLSRGPLMADNIGNVGNMSEGRGFRGDEVERTPRRLEFSGPASPWLSTACVVHGRGGRSHRQRNAFGQHVRRNGAGLAASGWRLRRRQAGGSRTRCGRDGNSCLGNLAPTGRRRSWPVGPSAQPVWRQP